MDSGRECDFTFGVYFSRVLMLAVLLTEIVPQDGLPLSLRAEDQLDGLADGDRLFGVESDRYFRGRYSTEFSHSFATED